MYPRNKNVYFSKNWMSLKRKLADRRPTAGWNKLRNSIAEIENDLFFCRPQANFFITARKLEFGLTVSFFFFFTVG